MTAHPTIYEVLRPIRSMGAKRGDYLWLDPSARNEVRVVRLFCLDGADFYNAVADGGVKECPVQPPPFMELE